MAWSLPCQNQPLLAQGAAKGPLASALSCLHFLPPAAVSPSLPHGFPRTHKPAIITLLHDVHLVTLTQLQLVLILGLVLVKCPVPARHQLPIKPLVLPWGRAWAEPDMAAARNRTAPGTLAVPCPCLLPPASSLFPAPQGCFAPERGVAVPG